MEGSTKNGRGNSDSNDDNEGNDDDYGSYVSHFKMVDCDNDDNKTTINSTNYHYRGDISNNGHINDDNNNDAFSNYLDKENTSVSNKKNKYYQM